MDYEAGMAKADDIRLTPTPDSTDAAQQSLGDGIRPIRAPETERDTTIVQCPVCFGVSANGVIACDVCHSVGKLQLVWRGVEVPEYRTIDTSAIVMNIPLPTPMPKIASFIDRRTAEERLLLLLDLLRGVGSDNKLFKVRVIHRSPLDGENETSFIHTWARDEQQAVYVATHDAAQRLWAKADGRPEFVRNAPVITSIWIAAVMDIPIP